MDELAGKIVPENVDLSALTHPLRARPSCAKWTSSPLWWLLLPAIARRVPLDSLRAGSCRAVSLVLYELPHCGRGACCA